MGLNMSVPEKFPTYFRKNFQPAVHWKTLSVSLTLFESVKNKSSKGKGGFRLSYAVPKI